MTETISTEELASANNALSMMLDGINEVRKAGMIPTVEQISISALHAVNRKSKSEEDQKRFLAVLLAVAIAKLSQS